MVGSVPPIELPRRDEDAPLGQPVDGVPARLPPADPEIKASCARLDGEARMIQAKGADVTFWALALTARGDLITF